MKEKILSIISLVTIFVPLTMLFVWNLRLQMQQLLLLVTVFLLLPVFFTHYSYFSKKQQRDIYVKVGLGVNAFYLLGILFMVIIPRLF